MPTIENFWECDAWERVRRVDSQLDECFRRRVLDLRPSQIRGPLAVGRRIAVDSGRRSGVGSATVGWASL